MPPNLQNPKRRASSEPELEKTTKPSKKPRARAPRKSQPVTEDEKDDATEKKEAIKRFREAKKEWDASLVPWKVDEEFKWPTGTLGMYKSDVKSQYLLTDTDLLSLPHESIPPKSFFKYHDVRDLAKKKWESGAMKVKEGWELPEVRNKGEIRLFKKTDKMENPNTNSSKSKSTSTLISSGPSTSSSSSSTASRWSDLGFVYIRMIGVHDGSDKTSTSEGTRAREKRSRNTGKGCVDKGAGDGEGEGDGVDADENGVD